MTTRHDAASGARASAAQAWSRVRPTLRRGLAHLGPVERAASRLAAARQGAPATAETRRLVEFYEAMRERFNPGLPAATDTPPSVEEIDRVQQTALRSDYIHQGFFRMTRNDGGVEHALAQATRVMFEHEHWAQARSFAQVLLTYEGLRPAAHLALALGAEQGPMPMTAWDYLHDVDPALALTWAPDLWFRYAFVLEPDSAADLLRRGLDGDTAIGSDIDWWADIAVSAFAGGADDLALRALERVDALLPGIRRAQRADDLRRRSDVVRAFVQRRRRPAPTPPAGAVPFAVLAHHHPDRRRAATDVADPIESLAALVHLARRRDVTFTGDADLVALAERLRGDVDRTVDGPAATVSLHAVDRDVPACTALPDGTWVVWSGHVADPLMRLTFAPPNPALRPLFVGVEIDSATLGAPGVVELLRAHAPVGARNWDTVFLLLAAGVPAFFSGAVPATLGVLGPVTGEGATLRVAADEGAGGLSLHRADLPERPAADALSAARDAVHAIRRAARVVTPDLAPYLVARGSGVPVEQVPPAVWSSDHAGLVALDDATFAAVHDGLSRRLATVLDAVLGGADADAVQAAWSQACSADVDAARARLAAGATWPTLDFDPQLVSDAIRAASVTVERTDDSVVGDEVNVEFSLDGNYKHQLDIVLDSVVAHTQRPIRAFVLCRDHGPADHERMAKLFPMVSFVWLSTDDVVYGPIAGLVPHVTFATMDRTLLPLIAPEIDRIMHLDLDLLVLGDIGELFDTDMGDRPLAAIVEAQNRFRSGFDTVRRAADRLREEGQPQIAEQLTATIAGLHPFDFEVFNAGVMVMNLDRMRRDDFCRRYLPFVQYFGVNGQEVLNFYVGDDYTRVDRHWNQLSRLEKWDAPNIAHWAGPHKPWKGVWVTGRVEWNDAVRAFGDRVEKLTGNRADANLP